MNQHRCRNEHISSLIKCLSIDNNTMVYAQLNSFHKMTSYLLIIIDKNTTINKYHFMEQLHNTPSQKCFIVLLMWYNAQRDRWNE